MKVTQKRVYFNDNLKFSKETLVFDGDSKGYKKTPKPRGWVQNVYNFPQGMLFSDVISLPVHIIHGFLVFEAISSLESIRGGNPSPHD